MRNWHNKIIKSDSLISNSDITIGFIDVGTLEFVRNGGDISILDVDLPFYKHPHLSFMNNKETLEINRVFYRKKDDTNKNIYSQKILINNIVTLGLIRNHIASVAGIMAGKDVYTDINKATLVSGISQNSFLINSLNIEDIFILARINKYSYGNFISFYYKKNVNQNYLTDKVPNDFPLSSTYSDLNADIINLSISWEFSRRDSFSKSGTLFLMSENFAYGRNGRGVIIINSAGNGKRITGSGTSEDEVEYEGIKFGEQNQPLSISNKSIMVGASSLDSTLFYLNASSYDNLINLPENKAKYSNYGERLDLCAPSSPDPLPKISTLSICAPTIKFCGEIGYEEDYISKKVSKIINPTKDGDFLTLELENTFKVFAGQSVELGNKNSFANEIRFIVEVDREKNQIKLNRDRFFSRNISINDIKILLYKKVIQRITTNLAEKNIFLNTEDSKGIRKNQNVLIYSKNDETKFSYTKISKIEGKKIEFETADLSKFGDKEEVYLIPDQMKAELTSTGNGYYTYSDLEGFFSGQLIRFIYKNKEYITDLTEITNSKAYTTITRQIESNEVIKIESLSYGHYTSRFGGTSAAAPIVSGVAALVLSANSQLNAAEVKHILKVTADKIGGVTYTKSEKIEDYNFQYSSHEYFGTGRVNAEKAIQLAKEWHKTAPDIPVEKPRMIFWRDATNPAISIEGAGVNGSFNANRDQNIKIKIKNVGNRYSFRETDLRVLIAITSTDEDRKFKFPDCWYENSKTEKIDEKDILIYKYALIDVQEISPIDKNGEYTATVELKRNAELFKNYISSRHRVFILAHIAPFDGTNSDLAGYTSQNTEYNNSSLVFDITNNKNLAAVEIIPTVSVPSKKLSDGTKVPLNGENYNLIATNIEKHEKFCVDIYNVQATELDTKQFKFSLLDKPNGAVESEVIIKKTNGNWDLSNLPNWLTADIVETGSALYAATHKNAEINYALSYDLTKAGKQIQFAVI